METDSHGKIITFYSYKGGTGRSMALANVAWILASNGKKVLVVDWDLEAPGLHRYFYPFLLDKDLTSSEGLIDFVIDFSVEAATPGDENEEPDRDWYKNHANILRYTVSLDWQFPGKGTLDFIPAGRQGTMYSKHVNSFNWQNFYDRLGGGVFLEAAKDNMKTEYDYILIDSRTGVSDTSGICTVQLPDILVVCFTLNYQSIEGAAAVASSVWEQRRKSDLLIFPVPMRVENNEKEKLEQRREYARKSFSRFPCHLSSEEKDKYWGEVEVMYFPYYAYEELLAPFGDKPGRTNTLLASAERVTSYITNGEIRQLAPISESVRLEVIEKYARKNPKAGGDDDLIKSAEKVFQMFSADNRETARRVLTRLVRMSRPGELGENTRLRVKVCDWDKSAKPVIDEMILAGLLVRGTDDITKEETIELVSDSLIQKWDRLKQWLSDDFDFLIWRHQLQVNIGDWEGSNRDKGALLSGAPLDVAKEWQQVRSDYLNKPEMAYINESALFARKQSNKQMAARSVVIVLLALFIIGSVVWRIHQKKIEDESAAALKASTDYITGGSVYLSNKQYEDAIAEFTKAVDAKPDNPKAYYNRGLAYYQAQSYDSAIDNFSQAIKLDSNFAEAYTQRGRIYRQKNEFDRAIDDYNEAIRLKPDSAEAHNFRGFAYLKKKQYDKALADCNKAIEIDPNYANAYDTRGSIYRDRGEFDNAIIEYNTALNLNPDFAYPYLNRGLTYFQKNNIGLAIADYTKAIQCRPELTDAYYNRGLAYINSKATEHAIADFQQVLSLSDDLNQRKAASDILIKLSPANEAPAAPIISIRYVDQNDASKINQVRNDIEKSKGFKVQGVLLVSEDITGNVRYYHLEDGSNAIKIKNAFTDSIYSLTRVRLNLRLTYRDNTSKNAPPGTIEVWLPSLSAKSASSGSEDLQYFTVRGLDRALKSRAAKRSQMKR